MKIFLKQHALLLCFIFINSLLKEKNLRYSQCLQFFKVIVLRLLGELAVLDKFKINGFFQATHKDLCFYTWSHQFQGFVIVF